MRAKWDEQHGGQTYGELTVATALAGRSAFYGASSTTSSDLDLNHFMTTDAGNAEAFAASYRGAVVFDHRLQRWLIRGQHRWVPDNVAEVRLYAKRVARRRLRAAAEIQEEERRKRAIKHALSSESRQRLDAMVELARSEEAIADAGYRWDSSPGLIAVENGVIDLDTGQLRPGRPEDRITLALPVALSARRDLREVGALPGRDLRG
jgi:putative DNA primase/helicase